jgi:hypothetical protein
MQLVKLVSLRSLPHGNDRGLLDSDILLGGTNLRQPVTKRTIFQIGWKQLWLAAL